MCVDGLAEELQESLIISDGEDSSTAVWMWKALNALGTRGR
jgi:hypothetical protein